MLLNGHINSILYFSDQLGLETWSGNQQHQGDADDQGEVCDAQISNCTVLCGSFNPLHDGHIKLLEATH